MDVIDIPVPHEDGSFVSERVSRIVELIREYDPNLDVRWIPSRARKMGEAAFAIVEHCSDGQTRTAFLVQTEDEFDERVLARIYNGDTRKQGDVRLRLESMQKAVREVERKKFEESLEEAADYSVSMIRNPKHRVQLGKGKYVNL